MSFEVSLEMAMTILRSLPKDYYTLTLTIEARTEPLTTEYVITRLLQEEQRYSDSLPTGEMALVSKTKRTQGKRKSKDKPKCTYCGKIGHTEQKCYKKRDNESHVSANAATGIAHAFAGFASSKKFLQDKWLVDSGATQHMSCNSHWFSSMQDIPPKEIRLGDHGITHATGLGSIRITATQGEEPLNGTLTNVLYAPDLAGNLLSVPRLLDQGYRTHFVEKHLAVITDMSGNIVMRANRNQDMFLLNVRVAQDKVASANAALTSDEDITLWHRRLGHANYQLIRAMAKRNAVNGLDITGQDGINVTSCIACTQGKQHRAHVSKTSHVEPSTELLHIVHSDVCGPMTIPSIGGKFYFATFIDDCSRKVWVSFLRHKSDLAQAFMDFHVLAEKQSGKRIKILRSDNGGEYISGKMQQYLSQNGIQWQPTAPHTPEYNGVAERMNRTLIDMARTMLIAAKLGTEYWAEAIYTAAHIHNRRTTKRRKHVTPQELWTGTAPSISHLRVFGCPAYVLQEKGKRNKFEPKSLPYIFLGYVEGTSTYRLYNPATKRLITSRDVIFDEQGTDKLAEAPATTAPAKEEASFTLGGDSHFKAPGDATPTVPAREPPPSIVQDTDTACQSDADNGESDDTTDERQPPARPDRPQRDARPPARYADQYGKAHTAANIAFTPDEPTTVDEALNSPDAALWQEAMDEEYESLIENGTWKLTPLPAGRKAIGCKWVYRKKLTETGSIDKYKARLVAKGFAQTQGIDYQETFSPVVKFASIRTLLAIAVKHGYEVHQMDVVTAYLNGDLLEDVYMTQPEGYRNSNQVCKLNRSLYGLKQSGRAWYEKIDSTFIKFGFRRTDADPSLYCRITDNETLYVAIYVDDLIIVGNDQAAINKLKIELSTTFKMKDLGRIHYILGIKIVYDAGKTITLSQAHYVDAILQRYNMDNARPAGAPIDPNVELAKPTEDATAEERKHMATVPYMSAIGSLLYLAQATRPDLSFAVSLLSRYSSDPRPVHWTAVKHIMRYLRSTRDLAITYTCDDQQSPHGYCDADWANDKDSRRSTSGYTFCMSGAAITWSSKRQQTVALSSTEAEYMAATHATKEAVWLSKLLAELNISINPPMTISCDNQSCIALAKNPIHHQRTKHIDIQYHYIRERLRDNTVKLEYCPTEEMVADVLTKGLSKGKHSYFTEKLGLQASC